jgi:hypothetical protein
MAQRLPLAGSHTYRLKLDEDGRGSARDIEFEAPGAEVALRMARDMCGGRAVQLFEDGRKLADLKLANMSFWIVS